MKTVTLGCVRAIAIILLVLAAWVGAARADTPVGTAFTFQGQLRDSGLPAAGLYDFQFKLFDAASGGVQQGVTLAVTSVSVSNGQFNVMLDFGGGFAGSARWIEIAVAPSRGSYTTLSPRQMLSPVPYALCASSVVPNGVTNTMLASDGNSLNKVSGGLMYSVPGASFIGINRNNQVSTQEYFGVLAPTTAWGGMYMKTTGASGLPFYGYAAGSGYTAFHGMDGASGNWFLYNNGYHLTVTASGNVGINTQSPAQLLEVFSPTQATMRVHGTTPTAGSVLELMNSYSGTPDVLGAINFLKADASVPGQIACTGASDLTFRAGGSERMRIAGNGNVGIGETNPENTLHVKKGSAGSVTGNAEAPLIVENSGNAYVNMLTPDSKESGILFGLASDGANGGIIYNNFGALKGMQFRTNGNATRMTLDSTGNLNLSGNLGLGTSSPAHKVHILQGGTADALYAVQYGTAPCGVFQMLNVSSFNNALYVTSNASIAAAAHIENTNGGPGLLVDGNVGIGTAAPAVPLHVDGGTDVSPSGGGYFVVGATAGLNVAYDDNEIMARNNGAVSPLYINYNGGDVYIASQATTHVRVLEITGADVAERFPVTEKVEPGMVVMIDTDHPGQLCLARGAYNRRVAGVVSGANNLPTGTVMGNLPGNEKSPAIALNGRVWVHCVAAEKAVEPGDFLTTSARPGYAMPVGDAARGAGATLGKAMTGLKKGETGLVLTLVNLQ